MASKEREETSSMSSSKEQSNFKESLVAFGFAPPSRQNSTQEGVPAVEPSAISTRSASVSAAGNRSRTGHTSPPALKRAASSLSSNTSRSSFKRNKSSGYAAPSKYAHLKNNLADTLDPDLICVFIGLNPGLKTATTGHAYAHPTNLFWRLLHSSGCTGRRCAPGETYNLPRLYGLGNTNIVERATANGAELSKEEMDDGVAILDAKVARCRPQAVVIVGKSIWESIWRVWKGRSIKPAEFHYGWQGDELRMGMPNRRNHRTRTRPVSSFFTSSKRSSSTVEEPNLKSDDQGTNDNDGDGDNKHNNDNNDDDVNDFKNESEDEDEIENDNDNDNKTNNKASGRQAKQQDPDWRGARVFVATTTSGLAAGMRPQDKEAIWRELGQWVEQERTERGLTGARYMKDDGTVETRKQEQK